MSKNRERSAVVSNVHETARGGFLVQFTLEGSPKGRGGYAADTPPDLGDRIRVKEEGGGLWARIY